MKIPDEKSDAFDWLKRFVLVVVAIWIVVSIVALAVGVVLWGL